MRLITGYSNLHLRAMAYEIHAKELKEDLRPSSIFKTSPFEITYWMLQYNESPNNRTTKSKPTNTDSKIALIRQNSQNSLHYKDFSIHMLYLRGMKILCNFFIRFSWKAFSRQIIIAYLSQQFTRYTPPPQPDSNHPPKPAPPTEPPNSKSRINNFLHPISCIKF